MKIMSVGRETEGSHNYYQLKMKRIGNLYSQICTIENIEEADRKARLGKKYRYGINKHDKHRDRDNQNLLNILKELSYKTSEYKTFKIYEPKERVIYRLPYYPDRITHHALMNILEPIWNKVFIKNTYSCIKGRGITLCAKDVKKALEDKEGTKYCLKFDIRKFYPSIDHDILKKIIRRKIKDKELLAVLDSIIDSTDGVPIGNYLSQFFANLYLAYYDHYMKEAVGVKYYFRYADDIVILSDSKDKLREIFDKSSEYISGLKLQVKSNWQIFPVDKRGIDFVGYKFYHSHVLLRKSIKKRITTLIHKWKQSKISFKELKLSMVAYFGWLKYCNSKHYLSKIEKITSIHYSNWVGIKASIKDFYNKNIYPIDCIPTSKSYKIDFIYKGVHYFLHSKNPILKICTYK